MAGRLRGTVPDLDPTATGIDAKQLALVRQDMLAPNMPLTGLLRFSSALEGLATGVIVHRAGHTVVDFATWAAAAASAQRPSEPWVPLCSDEASVCSEGTDLFHLPDVRVLVRGDDRLRDRATAEALVRAACDTMVRENRILNGDVVLATDGSGYTAKDTGVHVELSPLERAPRASAGPGSRHGALSKRSRSRPPRCYDVWTCEPSGQSSVCSRVRRAGHPPRRRPNQERSPGP